MLKALWIALLSLGLLVFGGVTAMCVVGLITRHHLSFTGFVILLSNGFISWMLLDYLVLQIRGPRKALPAGDDTPRRF